MKKSSEKGPNVIRNGRSFWAPKIQENRLWSRPWALWWRSGDHFIIILREKKADLVFFVFVDGFLDAQGSIREAKTVIIAGRGIKNRGFAKMKKVEFREPFGSHFGALLDVFLEPWVLSGTLDGHSGASRGAKSEKKKRSKK